MARTHGRIKVEVWDAGSDYRNLSVDAQWAYQMLVSQPQISMCGTLAYTPKKWARLAAGLSLERLETAIFELEQAWYVIVDRDTDEILVRTFIKHDRPWKLENLVKAARKQIREIDSDAISSYLARRHEWLMDASIDPEPYEETRASERASERTLPLASEQAFESRAGTRSARDADTRTSPSPTTTPSPEEQNSNQSNDYPGPDGLAGLPVDLELAQARAADDQETDVAPRGADAIGA